MRLGRLHRSAAPRTVHEYLVLSILMPGFCLPHFLLQRSAPPHTNHINHNIPLTSVALGLDMSSCILEYNDRAVPAIGAAYDPLSL